MLGEAKAVGTATRRLTTQRPTPQCCPKKLSQTGKKLQPQIVAGALACMDLVCSAGFEERYAYAAGESASGPNTKLYL